jgi:hypothetical protein
MPAQLVPSAPTIQETVMLPAAAFALGPAIEQCLLVGDQTFAPVQAELSRLIRLVDVVEPSDEHRVVVRTLALVAKLLQQKRVPVARGQIRGLAEFLQHCPALAAIEVTSTKVVYSHVNEAFNALREAYHQAQLTGRDMVVPVEAWHTLQTHFETVQATPAPMPEEHRRAVAVARKWVGEDTFVGQICHQLLARIQDLEAHQQLGLPSAIPDETPRPVLYDSRA